jgi:hypothetical protein
MSKECAPALVISMSHPMSRGLAEDSWKPLVQHRDSGADRARRYSGDIGRWDGTASGRIPAALEAAPMNAPKDVMNRVKHTQDAGIARPDFCSWSHWRKPFRGPMVGKRPVEPDNGVSVNVRCGTRRAVTLDVAPACIDCPDGIGDLLAYKIFIGGLAWAQGDIGLSFGKIE